MTKELAYNNKCLGVEFTPTMKDEFDHAIRNGVASGSRIFGIDHSGTNFKNSDYDYFVNMNNYPALHEGYSKHSALMHPNDENARSYGNSTISITYGYNNVILVSSANLERITITTKIMKNLRDCGLIKHKDKADRIMNFEIILDGLEELTNGGIIDE